jgi:hypothetical protein
MAMTGWRTGVLISAVSLLLLGCAGNPHNLSGHYLDQFAEADPTPANFRECHGFGCAEKSRVSLDRHQWHTVAAVFSPAPRNSQDERRRIAKAIALMQRLVGAQTGTSAHQWTHKDRRIRPNFGDPTQLDCIDEAVNTWTYLTMMERSKFFRFHRVEKLAFAGLPADTDPRNAAVIQEHGGGYFAVDPSLVDAGVPPPVIPLEKWLGKWPPELALDDQPKGHGPRA